jgi:hypothetical protein
VTPLVLGTAQIVVESAQRVHRALLHGIELEAVVVRNAAQGLQQLVEEGPVAVPLTCTTVVVISIQ